MYISVDIFYPAFPRTVQKSVLCKETSTVHAKNAFVKCHVLPVNVYICAARDVFTTIALLLQHGI